MSVEATAAMWARRDLTVRVDRLAERVLSSRVVVDNAPEWAWLPDAPVCWWCRLRPAVGRDHLIPRCQGGTDDPENLVPACNYCNSKKGGRTPSEFGELLRQQAAVMATPCPRCDAESGVPCIDARGLPKTSVVSDQHPERKFAMEYLRGAV